MTTLYPRITRDNLSETGARLAAMLAESRKQAEQTALDAQNILKGRTLEQVIEKFQAQINTDKIAGKTESHLHLGPSVLVCGQDVSEWFWDYHMQSGAEEGLSRDFLNALTPDYRKIWETFSHMNTRLIHEPKQERILQDDEYINEVRSTLILVIKHSER